MTALEFVQLFATAAMFVPVIVGVIAIAAIVKAVKS